MGRSNLVRCVHGRDAVRGGGTSLARRLNNVGKVPSGVSGVGNVGFMLKSSDVPGLTLYIEADTSDFETEGAFLALS